jgi:hypothetical protein
MFKLCLGNLSIDGFYLDLFSFQFTECNWNMQVEKPALELAIFK